MVSAPRLLIFDIDGVLTNGRVSLTASGEESKTLNFRDLDALSSLRGAGLEIAFVTGERGPLVDQIARRFGVTEVVQGAKDKAAAIERLSAARALPLTELWYVGDSDRDAPALSAAGCGLAPADATPKARAAASRVLQTRGGDGIAAEVEALIHQTTTPPSPIQTLLDDDLSAYRALAAQSAPILEQIAQTFVDAARADRQLLFFGTNGRLAAMIIGRAAGAYRQNVRALSLKQATLGARANNGDVVVAIASAEGQPSRWTARLQTAKQSGTILVGFTGRAPALPGCDLCFCAPADDRTVVDTLHLLAWQIIGQRMSGQIS